jgi:hypothetical protein
MNYEIIGFKLFEKIEINFKIVFNYFNSTYLIDILKVYNILNLSFKINNILKSNYSKIFLNIKRLNKVYKKN